jgi:hypothetical protein
VNMCAIMTYFHMYEIHDNVATYLMTTRRRNIDVACDYMLTQLKIDASTCMFDCVSDHVTCIDTIDNRSLQCIENNYVPLFDETTQ